MQGNNGELIKSDRDIKKKAEKRENERAIERETEEKR